MKTLFINPNTFDGDNNPKETQIDDIVLVNPDSNWHLYNHGSLELTRDCNEQYLDLWEFPMESSKPLEILIIGGGDFQLVYNLTRAGVDHVDIVDPHVEAYDEFHKFYVESEETYQEYEHSISRFPMTFGQFLSQYEGKHYDLVLIDVSEPILGITDEIYSSQFFDNLNTINSDSFMMYVPPLLFCVLLSYIRERFDMCYSKGSFIKDWNEQADVVTFKKRNR